MQDLELSSKKDLKKIEDAGKKRGPLGAAYEVARESIDAQSKASGDKCSTPHKRGKRLREILVRTLGIATDKSGKVAVGVTNGAIQSRVKISEEENVKKKIKNMAVRQLQLKDFLN